jgi:NADH-quinone oxidoreductase subunit N
MLSWVLTIALFSLAGVPPTAGFFGKLFLMMAGAAKGNYGIIIFAALNMVISFYYYLSVVKAIFMDENPNPIEKITVPMVSKIAMFICVIGVIITGLASVVYDYIHSISYGL